MCRGQARTQRQGEKESTPSHDLIDIDQSIGKNRRSSDLSFIELKDELNGFELFIEQPYLRNLGTAWPRIELTGMFQESMIAWSVLGGCSLPGFLQVYAKARRYLGNDFELRVRFTVPGCHLQPAAA
jgi:hypothetical protein